MSSEAATIKEATKQVTTFAVAMDAGLTAELMAGLSKLSERPRELTEFFDAVAELHDAAEMLLAVTSRFKNLARLPGASNV